jgi:predicted acyltransferase
MDLTVWRLFGCWSGALLQSKCTDAFKLKVLLAGSAEAFALSLALQRWNPMVKRLWTASFTFFSGGWVILGLAAFY